MSTPRAGRPRLSDRRRAGDTARDEVLDAAAELFTTRGYAATSTRRIAEAVGVRQASLYHHFATKDDILAALLSGTVAPPLETLRELEAAPLNPAVRLHALARSDGRQLWCGRWNLGILYLLPEVRSAPLRPFHRQRDELREGYRRLCRAVLADMAGDPATPAAPDVEPDEDAPFRLVESLPSLRADGDLRPDRPERTADLALLVLGWRGDWAGLRAASQGATGSSGLPSGVHHTAP